MNFLGSVFWELKWDIGFEALTSLTTDAIINILKCGTVYSDKSLPTFLKNILPPSSGQEQASNTVPDYLLDLFADTEEGECVLLTYE
jgi:hypothetical protein